MSHELDIRFFQELSKLDPVDVCKRTLCEYDAKRNCYNIDAWGGKYEVFPQNGEIKPVSTNMPTVNIYTGLTILFYLLKAVEKLVSGEWITEKDIPGGVSFFTGPHTIPTSLISDKYGSDIKGFKRTCEELGGEPENMGDASYQFRILRRVPVSILLWLGDKEFKPDVRLLFDKTISDHLPLDVVFSLTVELCNRIASESE